MAIYKTYANLVDPLSSGKPVVAPTDTIYGLLALAKNPQSVEEVYRLKTRNFQKPCIILISDYGQLDDFDLDFSDLARLTKYWPGPNSLILPAKDSPATAHLRRSKNSLAFRLADHQNLIELIKKTGPLIAPSANPEGLPPAKNIEQARAYFGEELDYLDLGERDSKPSNLIDLTAQEVKVLR